MVFKVCKNVDFTDKTHKISAISAKHCLDIAQTSWHMFKHAILLYFLFEF